MLILRKFLRDVPAVLGLLIILAGAPVYWLRTKLSRGR